MAGTPIVAKREHHAKSVVNLLREQFNKLVDDLELVRARLDAVCAKLDADAGVTDTNYQAGSYGGTNRVQAANLTASKVVI